MSRSYEMDMCSGPIFGKIVKFALPLMLSGMLQLLFNAADVVVVGQFSGNDALAAVGSTSALINLLVNLFIGVSVGASVLTGRFYGSGDIKSLHETVHTAMLAAVIGGIVMIFVGFAVSRPALALMETPENVIDHSVLYMRIYFAGMPFFVVYNFGAATLRAIGDTKRPLFFLIISGVVNVLLNLLFVIVFQMGVAGVATATVISQGVSAALVINCLCRTNGPYRLYIRELHIYKDKLLMMLKIGLPAGLQGAVISASNVLIQSSINSFESLAMSGNTAAANIDGFLYVSVNAVTQTSLSFTSQNMGAKQYKRINKILLECILLSGIMGSLLGTVSYFLGDKILSIFTPDPEVIAFGLERVTVMCIPYGLCGIMDVIPGCLRGMGSSVPPMLISIAGTCLFRVLWIYTVFAADHTLFTLYISYPVSWGATIIMQLICFFIVRKKKFPKKEELITASAEV